MEIKDHITKSYYTANPYDGILTIEDKLLEKEYIVVIDDHEYFGILTPCDLVKHPHKIVIDCLAEKEQISDDESILSIIDKVYKDRGPALPVFRDKKFIGVIEKHDLIGSLKEEIDGLLDKSVISQKLIKYFLDNLSHKIRTPLNGLLGFLELVSKLDPEEINEDEKLSFNIIRNCADEFLATMNDLIDLSLIDSGIDISISKKAFRVEDLFLELNNFFNTSASLIGRDISVYYSNPDPSFTFISDKKRIKQILFHLIDNALKYSNDTSVKFGYKVDIKNIIFYVSNNYLQNGEEAKEWLFKLFIEQENNYNQETPCFGIGLQLVKRFTTLLGGEINVIHNKNKITFFVSLPLS